MDTVELAWVSVLLYWGQQSTALDTEGEVAASAPDAAMAASQPQLATADSSAADEMRVFLVSHAFWSPISGNSQHRSRCQGCTLSKYQTLRRKALVRICVLMLHVAVAMRFSIIKTAAIACADLVVRQRGHEPG